MQINLQVHIHLDGIELDRTLSKLLSMLAAQAVQTAPEVFAGPNIHAPLPTAQETPVLPATETMDAEAPPPKNTKKKEPVGKRGALLPGALGGLPQPAPTTARLPFEALDPLVRSEMKRLSLDKRIPSHSLWNAERDPRLPSLGGVMARYGVGTLVELAEKLDMQPPLSASIVQGIKVEP